MLLIKNLRNWKHRRVLAAINSQSTDVAHLKLNNQIIGFAQRLTDAYGSDAHFVNAFGAISHQPQRKYLAQMCGTPEEHIHVFQGQTASVICRVADDLDADLIIIGSIGHTGLKGHVAGNTSERLLDHTDADILVLN